MNNPDGSEHKVSQIETIDLNRLRVFARVLEVGSFTQAARSLSLPKSSVSKAVSLLEDSLGVRLIQRTSRNLRATEAGIALCDTVRPALAAMSDALASAADHRIEPFGRVRLSCPPDLDELVAPYVSKFRRRYPRVTVEVSLTERLADLIGEGFDLALRGGELCDSSLVVRGVLRTELGLFASKAYLGERRAPRSAEELEELDCIGVRVTGGRAEWRLVSRAGAQHVRVPCAVTTNDMRCAAELASAGAGIALLPLLTTRRFVVSGRLVRVLPKLSVRDLSLRLVSPHRNLEPMSVRLFREGLLRETWARS